MNTVANRTSSGFRAKYHNEINDRWEMLIHCSHGFSLSANTVCITLCFVLKEPQQLGFLFKVKVKTYEIWVYHCINIEAKQSKDALMSCRMGFWFFSAESSSQKHRAGFCSFFFPTVSNSPKSLVYHIHVRYVTLLFFQNTGIFHQRQACTPSRYLIWNFYGGRSDISLAAWQKEGGSSGMPLALVFKTIHITWPAVLSTTCLNKAFIPYSHYLLGHLHIGNFFFLLPLKMCLHICLYHPRSS